MSTLVMGVFLILHGLVHLLYAAQSTRIFELRAGLAWPDGSWAFSRLLGDETSRLLASVFLLVVAVGFAAGGLGLLLSQDWWRPVTVGVAVLSVAIFMLFWDGGYQALADNGGVGLLISLAILLVVLVLKWPS